MDKKNEIDAFLGMDIGIEPTDTTDTTATTKRNKNAKTITTGRQSKTTTKASRKRPRPTSTNATATATAARKHPKKPKPPPNPPASLVSLLQTDTVVRSYFVSLQENLDYDVDKWKHEATKWKRLATTTATNNTNTATTNSSSRKKNGANKSNDAMAKAGNNGRKSGKSYVKRVRRSTYATSSKRRNAKKSSPIDKKSSERKNEHDIGETIPITDDALFGDFGSDSSDGDDDDDDSSSNGNNKDGVGADAVMNENNGHRMMTTKRKSQDLVTIEEKEVEKKRRSRIILEKIKEAKQCLDELGVSLVEVEVKTTTTTVTRQQQELPMMEDAKESRQVASHNGGGVVEGGNTSSTDGNSNLTTPASLGLDKDNSATAGSTTAAENITERNTDRPATTTSVERTLRRQSDEKVAAEMLASLRTLIKASSFVGSYSSSSNGAIVVVATDENNDDVSRTINNPLISPEENRRRARMHRLYHPFCRGGEMHVPNVYRVMSNGDDDDDDDIEKGGDCGGGKEAGADVMMPEHPASMGLKHLMTILFIMDTYCSEDMDEEEWNSIFVCDENADELLLDGEEGLVLPEDEDVAILRIGMRNRCHLAERVLTSLDVEITRIWALTDRATYLETASIHFHPADVLDMDDPTNEKVHDKMYGAKSYNRMANMEERISHARIASLSHHRRGNLQKAAELVVGYIVSSAPSLGGAEEYPKLSPALSLCVLEALLALENYVPKNSNDESRKCPPEEDGRGWFQKHMAHMFHAGSCAEDDDDSPVRTLLGALAHPVHVAASIWRERSLCSDDRVRDAAVVELAAYDRVRRLDGTWLLHPTFEWMDVEHIANVGMGILASVTSNSFLGCDGNDAGITLARTNEKRAVAGIACVVSLLTLGDIDQIIRLCDETSRNAMFLLPAYCSAYASVMHRKWESTKLIGSGGAGGRHTAAAFTVEDRFCIIDSIMQNIDLEDWSRIDVVIQCCVLMGDGHRLQQLANKVLPRLSKLLVASAPENSNHSNTDNMTMNRRRKQLLSRTMGSLIDAGEIPTVRVINLRRRPDRLLDFMGCAAHKEQLIVVKGPAKLRTRKSFLSGGVRKNDTEGCGDSCLDDDGDFAFDGRCSHEELETQVLEHLNGKKGTLADFVKAKWRPSDLKAFDRDARDGFELVPTSMTEKACSLSHIASWMGVESTLSPVGPINRGEYDHEWYRKKLSRMFKISGFARGSALLPSNEHMDPAPVCVILEDDAVLVDRFAERLANLLEELPRDFHFCSLGYSRPKAAPMVEYSTHLGIPSCLWYLTGYVLSLEGTRHLIESLPVIGPVDSWIGMKMCSNWDNKFGDLLGVGKFTKAKTSLPSRKDLAQIMKFRAFAALVPLCAQKVGSSSASTLTRDGGWRNKDTDITYSG